MIEAITNAVTRELNHAVGSVARSIQRRVLRMVLKAFFGLAGLIAVVTGLILMGSNYVGIELMLLLTGVLFAIAYFFM